MFGQSNVVHVVNDSPTAASYLQLWTDISANPVFATLRQQLQARNPIPPRRPRRRPRSRADAPAGRGVSAIFSPQQNLDALNWYVHLAATANDAVMMTFAFGMPTLFKDAYRHPRQAALRAAR